MKNKSLIASIIILSFMLSFLYSRIVVSAATEEFYAFQSKFILSVNDVNMDFNLVKDTYLLKIKYAIFAEHSQIYFNDLKIKPFNYYLDKEKDVRKAFLLKLPRNIVNAGKNSLKISFGDKPAQDIDISLTNYLKKIGRNIFVLPPDSAYLPPGRLSFGIISAVIAMLFILFGLSTCLLKSIFSAKDRALIYFLFSLQPFLYYLISLFLINQLSNSYKLVVTPFHFLGVGLVSFTLTLAGICIFRLLTLNNTALERETLNSGLKKLIRRLKESSLSSKCMLFAIIILAISQFILAFFSKVAAIRVEDFSYLILLLVLGIKLVRFMMKEQKSKLPL